MLAIRRRLAAENAQRDRELPDETYDSVYVKVAGTDGSPVKRKIDKVRPASRTSKST